MSYRLGMFRMDGSPYEGTWEEQTLAWANDLNDDRGRIIAQDHLWNGLFVSTVWIGLPALSFSVLPLIFETMVFDEIDPDSPIDMNYVCRYATLEEAHLGHGIVVEEMGRVWPTLVRWFKRSFDTREGLEEY